MNELQKLYDVLVRDGYYSKSFDEFKVQFQDPTYQDKVYGVVTRDGLFSKSKDEFLTKYSASGTVKPVAAVKKKEQPLQEESPSPSGMESPLAGGSLASPQSVSDRRTLTPLASNVDEEAFAGTLSQVAQQAQEMPMPTITPPAPVKRADETPKEKPYFTGAIGEVLSLMDSPLTPYGALGVGDFIDDIGRAVDAGYKQGSLVTPSNVLMTMGSEVSPEQIKKYIAANKDLERLGASDEMMQFSKTYEEEGKSIYGFLKGLAQNPGILPEIMISSTAALLNPSSLAAGGTVVGGGAAAGSLGLAAGAAAGAIASAPWAIGAAGTVLETGLTFSELLQEKLKERNLEFTEENVKTILEDQNALNSIRAKSVARGATIGIIDGFTGRLAGKVGAKLAKNTAASKVKSGLAASGIEMVGGSTGEAAGRLVAGQEMDVAEIALEGVAEAPMAIADVTAELLRKPIYEINGERRNEADVEFLIENASPDELSQMKINIKNDVNGYKKKIQDIVVDNQLRKDIKQANPNANEETINELLGLEKELQKFENNKTQSGKDKAAQIRSQIKTIQENAIQEQAAGQVPVQPASGVSQEVEEGKPQAEPQVAAEEGVQKEVKKTKLPEGVVIESAVTEDGEIDFDAEEQVRAIAKSRDLGITSDREIAYVAKDANGNIIGGAFTSYDGDKYTFDVVVSEGQEGTGIGSSLLDAVIKMPSDIKEMNPDAVIEVDVVNPVMQKMLEAKGFEVKETIGEGRVLMQPKVSSKTLEEQVSELEKMMTDEETNDLIDEFGLSVETVGDAQNALSRGDLVYVFDEATNAPTLVSDPTVLEEYTPDRITVVPREESPIAQQTESSATDFVLNPIAQTETVVVGSDKAQIDSIRSQTTDARKLSVLDMAQRGAAVLKSLFPNVDIALHTTKESYNDAMRILNQAEGTDGLFSYVKGDDGGLVGGRIDIDLSTAKASTVAHEIAHAIMLKAFGENTALFNEFRQRMSKVLSDSTIKQLNDFADQYEETASHEEFLVELAGVLAAEEKNLPLPLVQQIANIINDIVSKITGGAFVPFSGAADVKQLVDFFNSMTMALSKGEPIDIEAMSMNLSAPIGSPTQIKSKASLGSPISFPKTPLPLSFVTEADRVDMAKLIKEIADKKQMVWFWMADQLGRGYYSDEVIKGNHYLDAGPSFALDPKNRNNKVLWASGLPKTTLQSQIDKSDYIFFISGSPQKAKLFNKQVLLLIGRRIDETSSFDAFKKAINEFEKETNELNTIREALSKVNSFEELANSSKRKEFLIAIDNISKKKTAPKGSLKDLLSSFNAFVDLNELRDGFYKENDFQSNDIMLVGKPTGVGGKASHSTYQNEILGEVIGVPDVKIDAWQLMPDSIKNDPKYAKIKGREEKTKSLQTKIIAAEVGVVRGLEQQVKQMERSEVVTKARKTPNDAVKIVKMGRANGFSDEAISVVLERKGFTQEQINAALVTEGAGKRVEVTETFAEGYDRMMGEVDGIIEKGMKRGSTKEKILENAIKYMQGSRVYENATDVQREKMVRDVRKMFGKREKSAPKPEKLFGDAKDVKQITMSEYDLLKKQLKDTARGAKNAISLWRKTSIALASYLKKMVDGGHISMKQSASVLKKFSGVNLFDEKSINKFVEYMQKVFENAAYVEQIGKIRSMLPTAKKNVQTKLGVSEALVPLLSKLFAINPTLIPDSVFDKYVELVDMMGQRRTVLELEESGRVLDTTEEILNAIDEEISRSEELAEMFDAYLDKVLDEDGNIDFAATILQMLKDDVISEEDAKIMRKYKRDILPMVGKQPMSEEEISAEKEVLIEAVKEASVDSDGLPMKDERNLARELEKLIKTDGIEGLDNTQLKNLLRVIDNINNGYLPHYAQLMVERINAVNNGVKLEKAVTDAKPLKASSVYSKLKSLLTGKDRFTELIRRNPLFYIDQVFGNFKTKDIFDSVFEKVAEAQAMFKRSVTELNNKLDAAEEDVAKSFKFDGNKLTMSKFKMMTFMVQLEFLSNPDNNKVNPASKYLKKTIEHIRNGKSSFGERDADMLQEILDKYTGENGEIDNEKLYNSFNEAEKKAIKVIQNINESMRDKAIYTASVIRGDRIHPLNNYIHLNVLHEYRPDESLSGVAFVDSYNNSMRPSTKAKSLIERTGKVAPLNFDVFASANRGAKFVLMDYYLTEPIRTARKTINEASALLEQTAKDGKQQRNILNAIENAFEEATDNLLTSNFTSSSFGDKVVDFMSKQGYRAVLASLPRFAAELSSNVAFAMIASPKDFKSGVGYRGVVLSADAATIMGNVGSKQVNRLFPHDTLSGRLVDTSILNQASGVKGSRANNDVANKIQQIYNLSLKKYQNTVEVMADALIATPDKMVMRPMWFGAFANEFKSQTGKDIDFDKIAANDELYMAENKEAIDAARNVADQKTVLTGASDNAFMGILKGTPKPNQSALLRGFNMFNNFMTNFLIYEYMTARTGIMAAMGNGSISKKQGVALLGAVATRMTLYSLLTSLLSAGLVGLFVDDEDEDNEKSLLQKVGQSIASSFTSMALGRDFGNATKAVVNQGVEYVNENFLDFLREGEYDPYKDAIQYTVIPPERKGKQAAFSDLIMNMMGPFGPSIKTAEFAYRKATEPEKKEDEAISRSEQETQIRIPLEVLGNIGMIPLYKDVRKIVNAELYKGIRNAEKKAPMNNITKDDMKRYFPEMYESLYGEGGSLYDVEKTKSELRKEKELMEKKIKDDIYNYQPKRKD